MCRLKYLIPHPWVLFTHKFRLYYSEFTTSQLTETWKICRHYPSCASMHGARTGGRIGTWVFSNTGFCNGSPWGSQGDGGVGFRSTHYCRKQWWKQASRGSEHTSQGDKTLSHSILQHDQLWTSVSGLLGDQRLGCLRGDGNSKG